MAPPTSVIPVHLPDKNGIWGKLAFTASLFLTGIILYQHFRKRKTVKAEEELVMLNLRRARLDLGLDPDTGAPVRQY